MMFTYHPRDGHPPSKGWSPTIQNRVTNLPKDGHPFYKGWSPTIPTLVKHHPHDGHLQTVEWPTTIPGTVITFLRTVNHHFQDGQLDLEFDSCAAQLFFSYFLSDSSPTWNELLWQIHLFCGKMQLTDQLFYRNWKCQAEGLEVRLNVYNRMEYYIINIHWTSVYMPSLPKILFLHFTPLWL